MKIKLTLSYDGTRFSGWQRHPGRLTIQEKVEDALFEHFRSKVKVHGASRTDAGVHAEGQVAHFIPPKLIHLSEILRILNRHLPEDIKVTQAEKVSDEFHARDCAKSKEYEYTILNSLERNPKYRASAWWKPGPLDLSLMNEASEMLIGTHDFSSFESSGSHSPTPIRTLLEAVWRPDSPFVIFNVKGTGFLKFMIRNLVGTLCLVGEKKISPEIFYEILYKRNRSSAGQTAPACGLVLKKVYYS